MKEYGLYAYIYMYNTFIFSISYTVIVLTKPLFFDFKCYSFQLIPPSMLDFGIFLLSTLGFLLILGCNIVSPATKMLPKEYKGMV
jgi:hypothetical protein